MQCTIPQHQISCVEQIETVVSNAPDHKAVKLKLNSPQNRRCPGLWKFNNSLLDDEGYVTLIRENYSSISENKKKRLKWELLKMELRGFIIPYTTNKASNIP